MKYQLKIQKSKSIHLPYQIRKINEKNNLNTIKWTIDDKKDRITIDFRNRKKQSYNKNIIYRNVYSYSTVKVPSKIFEHFNIKVGDRIVLSIEEKEIIVTSKKKSRLVDISGIID